MTVLIFSYARQVIIFRPLLPSCTDQFAEKRVHHLLTMNSLRPTCLSSLSANYTFQDIERYQIIYYSTIHEYLLPHFSDYRFSATYWKSQHPSVLLQIISNTLLPSSLRVYHIGVYTTMIMVQQFCCIHCLSMAIYFCNDEFHMRITLFCSFHDKHTLVESAFYKIQVTLPAFSQTSSCSNARLYTPLNFTPSQSPHLQMIFLCSQTQQF